MIFKITKVEEEWLSLKVELELNTVAEIHWLKTILNGGLETVLGLTDSYESQDYMHTELGRSFWDKKHQLWKELDHMLDNIIP